MAGTLWGLGTWWSWLGFLWTKKEYRLERWILGIRSLYFLGGTMLFIGHEYYCADDSSRSEQHPDNNRQSFQHNAINVSRKPLTYTAFM
jgi:hypothetical protein